MRNTIHRYAGTKIKVVLDEQGRRQDWLADQVGVAPATVNRWINGSRTVDVANARKIAAILGVPLFLLFDVPIGSQIDPNETAEAIPA